MDVGKSLDLGEELEEEEVSPMAKKEEKKEAKKEEDDFDFDDDDDTEPRSLTSYLGWLFVLLVLLAVALWLFTDWGICVQF